MLAAGIGMAADVLGAASPAAGIDTAPASAWVVLEPIACAEALPGTYATCTVRAWNRAGRPLQLILRAAVPAGWSALTAMRSVDLEAEGVREIPFTVWVPSGATAGALQFLRVSAGDAAARFPPVEVETPVPVGRALGFSLDAASEEVRARPGEVAKMIAAARNTGNCALWIEWSARSIPAWPLDLSEERARLEPGAAAYLEVRTSVPPATPAGAIQLLEVTAVARAADGDSAPLSRSLQGRTTIDAPPDRPGLHASLPIEAAVSTGELAPGEHTHGLRLSTRGEAWTGSVIEIDADLNAGRRALGRDGWWNQHWLIGLARGTWRIRAGDVATELPELAAPAATLRGGSVESERSFGALRLLAGRNQTARPTGTWSLGLARTLAPGDRAGLNLLVKEDDAGTLGVRRTALACATMNRGAGEVRELALEAALSRTALGGEDRWGSAAQLRYDEARPRYVARLRGHLGSEGFAGRTRDRDGAAAYVLLAPATPLRLWSSADATRGRTAPDGVAPKTATGRFRFGGRYERAPWPALELHASGDRERAEHPDSLRDQDRRAVGAGLSRALGPLLASATGQWGTVRHARSGRSGSTRVIDLVCGGAVGPLRGAAQFFRSDDWDPEVSGRLRSETWTGDLAGGSPGGRWQVGLAFSSRRVTANGSERRVQRDLRFSPRIDFALRPALRVRVDGSLGGVDRPLAFDRWQIQLSYSGRESLPLPWRPVRGSVRGLVFVDADGDREPDLSEERISRAMLRLDGRAFLTDESGAFDLPPLDPGTYWLELQPSSLPPGLVPRDGLPLEIRIEPGDDRLILVPLVASGSISGRIFLDSDRDGAPSPGEEGIPDLRIHLIRGGTLVAEALTDAAGRYRLGDLAPGSYELKVAEGWLPADWSATSPHPLPIALDHGEAAAAPPCGLAPRARPILRTFIGDSR